MTVEVLCDPTTAADCTTYQQNTSPISYTYCDANSPEDREILTPEFNLKTVIESYGFNVPPLEEDYEVCVHAFYWDPDNGYKDDGDRKSVNHHFIKIQRDGTHAHLSSAGWKTGEEYREYVEEMTIDDRIVMEAKSSFYNYFMTSDGDIVKWTDSHYNNTKAFIGMKFAKLPISTCAYTPMVYVDGF